MIALSGFKVSLFLWEKVFKILPKKYWHINYLVVMISIVVISWYIINCLFCNWHIIFNFKTLSLSFYPRLFYEKCRGQIAYFSFFESVLFENERLLLGEIKLIKIISLIFYKFLTSNWREVWKRFHVIWKLIKWQWEVNYYGESV